MADFSSFPEANDVLSAGKKPGEVVDKDGSITRNGVKVFDLPIHRTDAEVISCWQLSADEMREVMETGKVFLFVMGKTHPPVFITGKSPWGASESQFDINDYALDAKHE